MSKLRKHSNADHRVYLGDAIIGELRASELPLDPRQFEFWFAYKSGRNAALKAAADAIKARNGTLAAVDIDRLYEAHLSPFRLGERPDNAIAKLSARLQELAGTLEEAIGTSEEQRELLAAETAELSVSSALTLQDVLIAIDRLAHSNKANKARYALLEMRIDAVGRDVGALQRQLAMVREECRTDPTTGLPNRTIFDAALAKLFVDMPQPVSLLMCDLDYFAAFNENFGTFVGDQVLRSVGLLLKGHLRPTDTIARFGGDEFAAIIPHLPASEAAKHAERFRQVLMQHPLVPHVNGAGRVTASIGVAEMVKGDTAESLLRRAADGLAVAKREGRSRVVEMTPDGPVWDAGRRA